MGPGVGMDAALLRVGEGVLAAAADPITFVAEGAARYLLTVNANDLAVIGAEPRWFLATLLFPEGTGKEAVVRLFAELGAACDALGVGLIGGHSEVTPGLDRPLLAGTMLGMVDGEPVLPSGMAVGDHLLLTKGIPLEATAILASERAGELQEQFGAELVERCRGLLDEPGLSVLPEARLARSTGGVHAMHDPTEGGLATGLQELARAGRVGLVVRQQAVSLIKEGRVVCEYFGIDPWGAIASGALLLAVAPERSEAQLAALGRAGIPAVRIGEVLPAEEGCLLETSRGVHPLPVFPRDEVARLLESG